MIDLHEKKNKFILLFFKKDATTFSYTFEKNTDE